MKDSVTHVGFSFDGTYVATGDMTGLIQVWKLFESEPVWNEKIEELQVNWFYEYSVISVCVLIILLMVNNDKRIQESEI